MQSTSSRFKSCAFYTPPRIAPSNLDNYQSTEYTAKMRRAPSSHPSNLPALTAVYAFSNVSKRQWEFVFSSFVCTLKVNGVLPCDALDRLGKIKKNTSSCVSNSCRSLRNHHSRWDIRNRHRKPEVACANRGNIPCASPYSPWESYGASRISLSSDGLCLRLNRRQSGRTRSTAQPSCPTAPAPPAAPRKSP